MTGLLNHKYPLPRVTRVTPEQSRSVITSIMALFIMTEQLHKWLLKVIVEMPQHLQEAPPPRVSIIIHIHILYLKRALATSQSSFKISCYLYKSPNIFIFLPVTTSLPPSPSSRISYSSDICLGDPRNLRLCKCYLLY